MWRKARTHLITGALILIPLGITYIVFNMLLKIVNHNLALPVGEFLIKLLHGAPGGWVATYAAPAIGILLLLLLTFLTGMFGSSLFGRHLFDAVENMIQHIPFFKSVYGAIKQIVNEFSPGERKSFRKVVLVERSDGQAQIGFLTSELSVEGGAKTPMRSVYIPTNHLWFGEIRLVPAERVADVDMTVEQGISYILSCGAAAPATLKKQKS